MTGRRKITTTANGSSSFGFDGGTTIAACGTEPPENYAAFRREFLSLISSLVQELEAEKDE